MKRVSFKVAKVLKEAGYPQEDLSECYQYPEDNSAIPLACFACKPTYLEVWLWLWQNKNIHIELLDSKITTQCYASINDSKDTFLFASPEEAIIAAIEYLVDNNLIK